MFAILKAKTHHHNTHYDFALTHQNLQWVWFLSIDSMQKLFGDDTTCATESPIYMEKMCIHTYCLSLQNFKKMAPKRSLPMHSESLSAHLKVAARPPWVCRVMTARYPCNVTGTAGRHGFVAWWLRDIRAKVTGITRAPSGNLVITVHPHSPYDCHGKKSCLCCTVIAASEWYPYGDRTMLVGYVWCLRDYDL